MDWFGAVITISYECGCLSLAISFCKVDPSSYLRISIVFKVLFDLNVCTDFIICFWISL